MSSAEPASAGGPRFVDLHMHSTASDGVLPPADVVGSAAALGIAAIALTDHDSTAGIAEAAAAAAREGIRLIPGVELSAREGDRETHLLGLHIDDLQLLESRLVELRQSRVERALQIVARLRDLGILITTDAVFAESRNSAVGRPHIARVMVASGFVPSIRVAFDRYLGAGRPAFVAKEAFTVASAIDLIHGVGGLAVLAHPAADGNVDTLTAMKRIGLDGVEVLHPSHSGEDVARLGAIAQHLDLVRSGGSDWHGMDAGRRKLGGQEVPYEWLNLQIERVTQVRNARA